MSQLQLSKTDDPLASLRIDRGGRRGPRSRWTRKWALLVILVGGVAAAAFAWVIASDRTEVRVVPVEVRVPGVADSVLAAQGYLKSRTQAAIGAKVAGRIHKVYVEEGWQVWKNDLIAELEHGDMDALLDAMQASLEAMDASLEAMAASLVKSEAELSEVEATLAQDVRDFTRADQLFRTRGISAADYEKAQSKVRETRQRRDSLEAAVKLSEARMRESKARKIEAEARIRETEEQVKNYIVRAPFDGWVISKEAEVGESIMPGGMGAASGRGSVVTLADLFHLEVETDVKEDYLNRVRRNQEVSVAVDAVPDRRFKGRVRTIIPMGDRARGTVKVKVVLDEAEVAAVNSDLSPVLFSEMAATVHFMSEGKGAASGAVQPQVYAPADSVQKDEDGSFVWQVVDDRVSRVSVEVGESRESRVLIQRGLKGGERVVANPPANLKDSMPVKVLQ